MRGPRGACRVVREGTSGVRLACEGPSLLQSVQTGENGFDLLIKAGHEDLIRYRLVRARRWAKMALFDAHKLLLGTSDMLAWREGERIHTYHFLMLRTLGGKPFTCGTNPSRGAGNELEYKRHLVACRSLSLGSSPLVPTTGGGRK